MENITQKADVIWFKEPERIEDFDSEIWNNTPRNSYKVNIMAYLHWAVYRAELPLADHTRQLTRKYLAEFPEFVAEVRAVRPELLEM